MLRKYFIIITLSAITNFSSAQQLVSATFIDTYTQGDLILQGLFSAQNGASLYRIIYNTVDVHGNPTTASGAVAIPLLVDCDSFPLINYNHGTVLLKTDVPSYKSGEELVGLSAASIGAIGTMPDYLGLGDGPGFHPYQHAESEATATLDMIRACREFVKDSMGISLNGQVFLTGYSQGGHAAMATHKYIQDNNLTAEFNVIASAPCSGAYDMSETTADFVFNNSYSNPGYIVYLIESYQLAYGNIYTNRKNIYKAPYDTVILPYLNGTKTMASLNAVLPTQIDMLIQDSVLLNYKADTINFSHPLRIAMRDNDVYDWKPQVRIEMNYCEADEQVPYMNSIIALNKMQANGATDVTAVSRGATFDHGACAIPALTASQNLFQEMMKSCIGTGISENSIEDLFNVYPNPATSSVSFELKQANGNLKGKVISIYATDGRLMSQIIATEGINKLDISNYPKGLYFVEFNTDSKRITSKLIVQ